MKLTELSESNLAWGLAPARFAGWYPTRIQSKSLKYLGKPVPGVLSKLPTDGRPYKSWQYVEFDQGGKIFELRDGMLNTPGWFRVYYPVPYTLWQVLSNYGKLYMLANREVRDSYYHFTEVPEAMKARWVEMEKLYSAALFTRKIITFEGTQETDLAEVIEAAAYKWVLGRAVPTAPAPPKPTPAKALLFKRTPPRNPAAVPGTRPRTLDEVWGQVQAQPTPDNPTAEPIPETTAAPQPITITTTAPPWATVRQAPTVDQLLNAATQAQVAGFTEFLAARERERNQELANQNRERTAFQRHLDALANIVPNNTEPEVV